MSLLSQGSELATLWSPASSLNLLWHYTTRLLPRVWRMSYQRLQSLCTVLPAGWSASACLQGHMSTGTHWPWSSWASPSGHWHPGTQTLLPSCSSQLQPSHRSAQDVPHRRPHSWYTCPPEHCTAAGDTGRNQTELCSSVIFSQLGLYLSTAQMFHTTLTFHNTI